MKKLTIALDWTPNTNHTGLFIALEKGWYKNAGIDLIILSPDNDDYTITPAKKLANNEVDLAIAPTESLLSLRSKEVNVDVVAIAALLQEDTSAIVTLKDSGISSPKQLDGKSYASFKARYEDKIVQQIIINDGGKGAVNIVYPEKLGIWETIVNKKYDASWIFKAWEGIEAKTQGIELNYFTLKDYGIPYGYSPIIIAKNTDVQIKAEILQKFLSITKKGYLFAQTNVTESVEILSKFVPTHDVNSLNILNSQLFINNYYGNENTWGTMDENVFQYFCDWLLQTKIIDEPINARAYFVNL